MKRHELHSLGQSPVVRHCHAAFTGGDCLVCVEGIAGDAFGAVAPVLPGCVLVISPTGRKSMCRIFDDPKIVSCGEALQSREVHHYSTDMYRHDTDDFS